MQRRVNNYQFWLDVDNTLSEAKYVFKYHKFTLNKISTVINGIQQYLHNSERAILLVYDRHNTLRALPIPELNTPKNSLLNRTLFYFNLQYNKGNINERFMIAVVPYQFMLNDKNWCF